jgi:tetratricopeptide (TPR) repeat protein
MAGNPISPTQTPGPSPAEIREALSRLTASRQLSRSARLTAILVYCVEQTLAGNQSRLKQYSIGVDVLQRPESFDPATDAMVRVYVNDLRNRIAAYYNAEGSEDPVRIHVPVGSYTPVFIPNAKPARPLAETAESGARPPTGKGASRWKAFVIPGFVLMLTGAFFAALVLLPGRGSIPDPGVQAAQDQRPVLQVLNYSAATASQARALEAYTCALARFSTLSVRAVRVRPSNEKVTEALTYSLLVLQSAESDRVILRREENGEQLWSVPVPGSEGSGAICSKEPRSLVDLAARANATRLAGLNGLIYTDVLSRGKTVQRPFFACLRRYENFRREQTPQRHLRARECLEGLQGRDEFAAIKHSLLAHLHLETQFDGFNPLDMPPVDLALGQARAALQSEPRSATAWTAFAVAQFASGNAAGFAESADRAVDLNPYDGDNLAVIGLRLVQAGEYQAGLGLMKHLVGMSDFLPPSVDYARFLVAFAEGRLDEAEGHALSVRGIANTLYLAANAIVSQLAGDYVDALDQYAAAVEIDPSFFQDPARPYARRHYNPDLHARLTEALAPVTSRFGQRLNEVRGKSL